MAYKPTPGVLTEEDKVRRLLGEMGAGVEIDPILQKPFNATDFIPKEAKKDNTEEPTPSLAEPTETDKKAEESRISQMEEIKADPTVGGIRDEKKEEQPGESTSSSSSADSSDSKSADKSDDHWNGRVA